RSAADAAAARSAAAEWLRSQTGALRSEGERDVKQRIREAVRASEERAGVDTERRVEAETAKLRGELDQRLTNEVAAAREEAERAAAAAAHEAGDEWSRERAELQAELQATRRRLDEAQAQAQAAERRVTQVEEDGRRDLERERELRYRE